MKKFLEFFFGRNKYEKGNTKEKSVGLDGEKIFFLVKKCPKCGEFMAVRKLGVWGYYCINCKFWWGTYDPYPIVRKIKRTKQN